MMTPFRKLKETLFLSYPNFSLTALQITNVTVKVLVVYQRDRIPGHVEEYDFYVLPSGTIADSTC